MARKKNLHYRQLYINRPDPIVLILQVDYMMILVLYYSLHTHREASALTNEIPEESGQFLFLRVTCYVNIKGSVGLILAKTFLYLLTCHPVLLLSSLCRVLFVGDVLFHF
jgi:hypothetical protein